MAGLILLVHDDISTISAVRRLLSRDGHEVMLATSIADAMVTLSHHQPALVILAPSVEGSGGSDLDALVQLPEAQSARFLLLGEGISGWEVPVIGLPLDGAAFLESVNATLQYAGAEGWQVSEPAADSVAPQEPAAVEAAPVEEASQPGTLGDSLFEDLSPPPAESSSAVDAHLQAAMDETHAEMEAQAMAAVDASLQQGDEELRRLEEEVRAEAARRRIARQAEPIASAEPAPETSSELDFGEVGAEVRAESGAGPASNELDFGDVGAASDAAAGLSADERQALLEIRRQEDAAQVDEADEDIAVLMARERAAEQQRLADEAQYAAAIEAGGEPVVQAPEQGDEATAAVAELQEHGFEPGAAVEAGGEGQSYEQAGDAQSFDAVAAQEASGDGQSYEQASGVYEEGGYGEGELSGAVADGADAYGSQDVGSAEEAAGAAATAAEEQGAVESDAQAVDAIAQAQAAEEAARIEAEAQAAEAARIEAETNAADELARVEAETQAEAARLEAETQAGEEVARLEAEAQAEAARLEAETQAAEEVARLEADAQAAEAARLEAETQAAEEVARIEAEAQAAEAARLEAETQAAEEVARLEAEAQAAEAARLEAETQAAEEVARIEAEAQAEAARLEAETKGAEEAARVEAEAQAEAARLEAETKGAEEAARVEAEALAAAEVERIEAEAAEASRLEAEAKAAEEIAAIEAADPIGARDEVDVGFDAIAAEPAPSSPTDDGLDEAFGVAASEDPEPTDPRAVSDPPSAPPAIFAANEDQADDLAAEAAAYAMALVNQARVSTDVTEFGDRGDSEEQARLAEELEQSRAESQRAREEAEEARQLAAQERAIREAEERARHEAEELAERARAEAQGLKSLDGPLRGMPRSGTADLAELARIILRITSADAEARLELRAQQNVRVIYFRGGNVIAATSTAPEESVPARARRDGLIEPSQEGELRLLRASAPAELLKVMQDRGYLRPGEVISLVQRYVEQIALEAWSEPDSHFRLSEVGPASEVMEVSPTRPALHLLTEALRRGVDLEAGLDAIGGLGAIPSYLDAHPELGRYGFNERERKALRQVDGESALGALLLKAGMKQEPAVRAFLAARHLGLLAFRAPPPALADEHGALDLSRLAAKFDEVQSADYFTVLGLSRAAGSDEVQRAFEVLAAEFNPLRFAAHPDPSVQLKAQQVHDLLGEAARALADDALRTQYASSLVD